MALENKFTHNKVNEIIKLRLQNKTTKEISELTGFSKASINKYINLSIIKGDLGPKFIDLRSVRSIKSHRSNLSEEEKKLFYDKIKLAHHNKLMSADFDMLSFGRLRKRVFFEQGFECNKCHLNSWLGIPITLELEHKDGNNKNHSRENLEALCPNCHSQTNTWKGRNINKNTL